jgi:acyl-coenzyme A synthetase/AMP-(fatty) acid ligase
MRVSHWPERVGFGTLSFSRPEKHASLIPGRDMTWDEFMEADPVDCVPVAATDPLYILYTSGTTGIPKGVVRDNSGHLVALKWSMKHIYGVSPGDVFWAASDVGWVVGHSYIVYAPLAYAPIRPARLQKMIEPMRIGTDRIHGFFSGSMDSANS